METKSMKRIHKPFATSIVLTLCVFALGCETLTTGSAGSKKKKKDASSWSLFKKKEYQIPQTMNVTWSHDILTLAGKPPTRGFGGRFYFYNEKTQAIPVEGDLVVYGFDDTHKQRGTEDLNLADKRFRFTPEQFTTHFSEGELGASYSVWIPWDEAYGPPKKIMLLPTFLTKDGRLIRGAAASLNLPGKGSEDPNAGLIQQTSSVIPTALPGQIADARKIPSQNMGGNSGLKTTTIQVPTNSLKNHSISPDAYAALQNQYAINQAAAQMQPPANVFNANTQFSGTNEASNQAATFGNMANANPELSKANAPVSKQANLTTHSFFGPPTPMPTMRVSTDNNTTNGLALPEFSQANYSGLAPRSPLNPHPVPASQGVQQASYPNR
jgi:hypothetical protein